MVVRGNATQRGQKQLTRVSRPVRSRGLADTAKLATKRTVFLHEAHILYQLDLTRPQPREEMPERFELAEGGVERIPLLEQLPSLTAEEAHVRARRGATLRFVSGDGRPAFACWTFVRRALAARGGWLSLPDAVRCLEDSVKSPDCRGRGVAPAAWTAVTDRLPERALIPKVAIENVPSCRAVGNAGFVPGGCARRAERAPRWCTQTASRQRRLARELLLRMSAHVGAGLVQPHANARAEPRELHRREMHPSAGPRSGPPEPSQAPPAPRRRAGRPQYRHRGAPFSPLTPDRVRAGRARASVGPAGLAGARLVRTDVGWASLECRHRTRLGASEVWNKPNQQAFFRSADPARDCAVLFNAASPAAERADRRAVVIGNSLAESDADFTEGLYAHGVQGAFDVGSIHRYAGHRSPRDGLPHRGDGPGGGGWQERCGAPSPNPQGGLRRVQAAGRLPERDRACR
jgi:hypothetical protein